MVLQRALLQLFTNLFLLTQGLAVAQTTASSTAVTATSAPVTTPIITATSVSASTTGSVTTTSSFTVSNLTGPPDVLLNANLSVGRIELDVDNLQADINLAATVASLVTINAGIQASVQKINITIADVDVELDLQVRLGHLVDIVNRVFSSLDLNPLLITALNNVTSLVDDVVGAVDGLLGSITQNGQTLNFIIDNLGNIVQEIGSVSTIVGNYLDNMTETGTAQQLVNGFVQKTYSYSPLNAVVNIVFNAVGQVVQAVVAKPTGSSTTAAATSTAAARR
ncbi:hypothetical protein B7494_g2478 [Chlorociboria aeruginascens]|nr:hypothetical protein B7494_g2478 [Chlorociboria aeruginascens]